MSGAAFGLQHVYGVSDVSVEFVAEVVGEALGDAARNPEGFAPFTAVLNLDGSQRRSRYELGDDPAGTLELARAELGHTAESARCVALVWDGYVTTLGGEKVAVYVEVYELGRPYGHVIAQRYRRGRRGVSTTGLAAQDLTLRYPIVPLTAELMRRHLGEWTEQCRADLRDFVFDFHPGLPHADLVAFDDNPHACVPILEQWLSDLPFGELDTDDATAALAPLARYLAEVLIREYHGRWDVIADGEDFTHVVVVDGNDGLSHQLDPFALVREYADAPLPPLSAILRHALDLVHR